MSDEQITQIQGLSLSEWGGYWFNDEQLRDDDWDMDNRAFPDLRGAAKVIRQLMAENARLRKQV